MPCVDKVVIATSNKHKVEEIQFFLKAHRIESCSLADFDAILPPAETGKTFMENSELKARYYSEKLNLPVIADDSGLVVKALKGEPGIRSARYAGENASGVENNNSAFFQCVLSLILPSEKRIIFFVGKCDGKILSKYKNEIGFGYDPIFQPHGKEKTFSMMDQNEKNEISHRGIALRGLNKFLKSTF